MGNVNLWSKTASANDDADPSIDWLEGQAPSTVNDSARAMMAALANDRDDTRGALTTSGTSTAYTVATNSGNSTLQDGLEISAVIHTANGSSPTLNVDTLGAKPIYKASGTTVAAIASGDMIADYHATLQYDASLNSGSGAWVLMTPAATASVDLTSGNVTGTLPMSKGGTGNTVTGTSGQIAVSDGSKYVPATGATASEYRSAATDKILLADDVWSAAGTVALTDGTTIALDLSSGINFTLTIGGNRTLSNPTNVKVGQTGWIRIQQDGTGSRTLAYGSNYKWNAATAGVLSTTASAVDLLVYTVTGSSEIMLSFGGKGFG